MFPVPALYQAFIVLLLIITSIEREQHGVTQCSTVHNCTLKYAGQTGRIFSACFKEHVQAIRTNKSNPRYTQHILETQNTYDTIDETMQILLSQKKVHLLTTLEQFHIHNLTLQKQQTDTFTDTNKPIFSIILKHNSHNTTTLNHPHLLPPIATPHYKAQPPPCSSP